LFGYIGVEIQRRLNDLACCIFDKSVGLVLGVLEGCVRGWKVFACIDLVGFMLVGDR